MKLLFNILSYFILNFYFISINTQSTQTQTTKTPQEMFDEINFKNQMLSSISETLVDNKATPNYTPAFVKYVEDEWPWSCSEGMNQSPINFSGSLSGYSTKEVMKIEFINYKLVRGVALLTLYDSSVDTIKFIEDQGYLIVRKNGYLYKYNATEIQFHVPSEHTFDGMSGDLEMHIIHKKDEYYTQQMLIDNNLTKDPDEAFTLLYLAVIYQSVTDREDSNIRTLRVNNKGPVVNLDLSVYVPIESPFFFYEGSQTMPLPECTENVNWIVPMKMAVMSKAQVNFFISWLLNIYSSKGNARRTKNLNGRNVYFQLYKNPNPKSASNSNYINSKIILLIFIMVLLI